MADEMPRSDQDPIQAAQGWIARMASGAMDDADLAQFKVWREADPDHNRAFEQQRAIWRAIEPAGLIAASPKPRRPVRRLFRRHPGLSRRVPQLAAACAAALVAMVAGPDLLLSLRADHQTGAQVRHIALPDGTLAVLDAQSALAMHYSAHERRVEVLRGAVWFQVAHGDARPFRATALGGVTQDIGTGFEVSRQADDVTVGVTQGTVAVRGTAAPDVILHASQRAHYGRDGVVTRLGAVQADDIAVWRNDELLLHKASVKEAAAAIGHYHRGPIFVSGTHDTTRISAVFRTDRPDEAIDAVARMAGLSVYRMAGVTVLRDDR
jgi:transmembrane sensor